MLPKRTFSLKYSNGEDIVDIKTIKMLYKIIEENTNKHTENKMDKVNDNDNKEKNDSFDKITNWCKDTSIYCTIWLFDFDKNECNYYANSISTTEKNLLKKNEIIEYMSTRKKAFKLFGNDKKKR